MFLDILKILLHFQPYFKSPDMEKSYSSLKTDIEHNLLTLFNITAGSLISIFLLYGYWKGLPTYLLLGRLILIMLLVVTYFIGKKHLQIRKIILIVMSLGMVYLVMSNIHITSSYSLETAFIIGNLLSIMEMSLIVALRNVSQRFFMFIALLAIKVYFLMDESFVYSRKFGVILPIPLIFIMFYIYDQIHDRKMFKAAYGSNDKLKTLQELLFNKDSNLRLTITDLSLENILYSNQTFQTTFHDLSILNKIMLDISPSVLNAGSCYSSLKLETMPEISLATFLQNNILPENTTLNLQGNNPEENPSISYEIRVNKITWDGDFAYALIFTNIISKQGTLDVIKSAEEEKEKMIATVSHELRTPINGILGLIEMVSARTTDSQALIYLDNCRSCSKLLLYLVNSILNLSQFRNNKLAIHKEFLSLERYLEEIRSLYLFSSQQKGINFIIDKDPRVPQKIYTDQYKLTGILVNLLSNAMKFTFKGSVTLKIFPAAKEENNKIVFSVEDTGIGIQENDKAKLFKTFGVLQQKDKSINSQGVGLGLTIAKGLVEALSEDGEVKIEFASEYNKGSKFWFKLNIAGNVSNSPDFKIQEGALNDTTNIFNDTAYLLEQSLHSNRNPEINIRRYTKIKYNNNGINKFGCSGINSACTLTSNSQKKEPLGILIVDDYPLNIIAATFILEKFGYQITKAFSAEEALELLKKSKNESKRFCMIITDIQMPTMDGLQLSRIIREMIFNGEMYGLAIVGLTSKKLTEKDKREYKECGIDISLEKPLNKDEIKNVLQSLNLPFVI